ncbi:MAG: class I SAM-dependent methyltransferase [Pseudomonadota bacterium]
MRPMNPIWILREIATAGRENLDADHVANYDRKETIDVESELSVLRSLGLNGQSHVIDFGPGTGQLTMQIAARCKRVTAVDISPVMLQQLKKNIARLSVPNIDVIQAGFLSYQHVAARVDFIYSRLVLHHLPDFWKALALANARRCLRPGGILRLVDVVYHFGPEEAEARLNAWCETLTYSEPDGSWNRADIEEHIRDEHSTFTWILEPIIERCGFRIEEAKYAEDGIFASYVARAV